MFWLAIGTAAAVLAVLAKWHERRCRARQLSNVYQLRPRDPAGR